MIARAAVTRGAGNGELSMTSTIVANAFVTNADAGPAPVLAIASI